MIMHQLDARIRKLKAVLAGYRVRNTVDVEGIEISPRGKNEYVPFQNRDYWAKTEGENWYNFRFTAASCLTATVF